MNFAFNKNVESALVRRLMKNGTGASCSDGSSYIYRDKKMKSRSPVNAVAELSLLHWWYNGMILPQALAKCKYDADIPIGDPAFVMRKDRSTFPVALVIPGW